MKKAFITLALAVAIGIPAMGVHASDAYKAKPRPAPRKVVSAVCPVMKSKVPDITKAAGKSVYKGKTYYFCCSGCKPAFDKNPRKYTGR